MELLAINYLNRPISLRELKITRFTAGSIPAAFDNIPLAIEVTLEPRSCFLVHCERPLVESEARVAAESVTPQPGFSGAVNITARGMVRGKEVSFSAVSLKIDGRVISR